MRNRANPWNFYSEEMTPTPPRRSEQPFLFAYDISQPKRARAVLKCLRCWRADGQLSVHEAWLAPALAETLAVEVLGLIDPATDRLLLGRLSQRGGTPILGLSRTDGGPTLLGQPRGDWPVRLTSGWYLLAYDIRDEQRLRRVHQASARVCQFLQRSVYLYHGGGGALARLLAEIGQFIRRGEDDVRLYALNGPADLWFLCGPVPPLAALAGDASVPTRRARQNQSINPRGIVSWPS